MPAIHSIPLRHRLGRDERAAALRQRLRSLLAATKTGSEFTPAPIGLYFAALWYTEAVYPLVFTFSALDSTAKALHPLCPPTRR